MGAEFELKFTGTPEVQAAILADYPHGWERIAMQTTYFDTPSGNLSGKRYTLRQRLENGSSVCTLKTPGKGKLRGEWEVACADIRAAIPALCERGCPGDLPDLCREGLTAICGARFTRWARLLELPGCQAELALDCGSLLGGGRELPLCEIEMELKGGSREALEAFARSFAAKYSLRTEEKSKFARALSLYKEV